MTKGFLYALGACSLWGLSFVLPLFVSEFSSLEVALARYVVYGLISLLILLISPPKEKIPAQFWVLSILFALAGNVLYYILEVVSIFLLGGPLVALLWGTAPVAVCIYGNLRHKEFPFSIFVLPLLLILAGFMAMNIADFKVDENIGFWEVFWGLSAALTAILMWAWYAVANFRFLRDNPQISCGTWSTLIGVSCLISSLFLIAGMVLTMPETITLMKGGLDSSRILAFLGVACLLGLGTSWLGTLAWNQACLNLPVSLAGQLVVFEMIFALIYVYSFWQEWPTLHEVTGAVLVLGGILLSFQRVHKCKKAPSVVVPS